jgi:hypothetical protein
MSEDGDPLPLNDDDGGVLLHQEKALTGISDKMTAADGVSRKKGKTRTRNNVVLSCRGGNGQAEER